MEILFSRNLIKVLFATETFAMGVNMPARAVVFNSIRKHDGTQFRELEPGEYTQMAGRAGRRGLDAVGTVIMCCFGEVPPPLPILRNMLTGSSIRLQSQFRLTYNMILNLLRVEDMSVEGMIKRSFSEFATQRALTANEYPKLLARGEKTLTKLDDEFETEASTRLGAEDLPDYFKMCTDLQNTNQHLLEYVTAKADTTSASDDVLGSGRLLLLTAARKHGYVRTPALVLKSPMTTNALGVGFGKSPGSRSGGLGPSSSTKPSKKHPIVCLVLLPQSYVPGTTGSDDGSNAPLGTMNHIGEAKHRHYAIFEVSYDEILVISSERHKNDVSSLLKNDQRSRHGTGRPAGTPRWVWTKRLWWFVCRNESKRSA